MTPEIGQVREDSPASKGGLLKGDIIVSVDGQGTENWPQIKEIIQRNTGQPVDVKVKRGDGYVTLTVIPEISVTQNIFGEEIRSPLIGIVAAGTFEKVNLGPVAAIAEGLSKAFFSPFVLGGVAAYGLSSVFWLLLLSRVELSYAYPALSLGYVVITLISAFLLGEQVSALRWAAVLVICVGVVLLSRS